MNEIEDAVRSGRKAGDECRPGDRTLGWRRRSEPAEPAIVAELGEVGKIAPVTLDKIGIHSVYSEYDQLRGGLAAPTAAGEKKSDTECCGATAVTAHGSV